MFGTWFGMFVVNGAIAVCIIVAGSLNGAGALLVLLAFFLLMALRSLVRYRLLRHGTEVDAEVVEARNAVGYVNERRRIRIRLRVPLPDAKPVDTWVRSTGVLPEIGSRLPVRVGSGRRPRVMLDEDRIEDAFEARVRPADHGRIDRLEMEVQDLRLRVISLEQERDRNR